MILVNIREDEKSVNIGLKIWFVNTSIGVHKQFRKFGYRSWFRLWLIQRVI